MVDVMGVLCKDLFDWDDIQIIIVQLYKMLFFDEDLVDIKVVIGLNVQKLLYLDILFFVFDMSFGVLLEFVKVVLVCGVEFVGIGICFGEGGMFLEE